MMRRTLTVGQKCTRQLHISASRHLPASRPVEKASAGLDVQSFQQHALGAQKPMLLARGSSISPASSLPAAQKWFGQPPAVAFAAYMDEFQDWPFPYELVLPKTDGDRAASRFRDWLLTSTSITDQILAGILQSTVSEEGERTFHQMYAPLKLLTKAIEFNADQTPGSTDILQLYIAQSSLSDLPTPLQQDLPTPDLIKQVGKGDVYSSSIWLGTEPTYTPLHRDPNPNLFCQLNSRKIVRLLPPALGDRLFFEVQVKIRQQGSSRIRSAESMMQGQEREALHEAVWENDSLPDDVYETEVGAGDSLFIPDGWWHSVKSAKSDGQLNASVNWWFR